MNIMAHEVTKVQIVTGYNHDRADLVAGGSLVLGPYLWCPKEDLEWFVQYLKALYPKEEIRVFEKSLRSGAAPSREDFVARFRTHLNDPRNWPDERISALNAD